MATDILLRSGGTHVAINFWTQGSTTASAAPTAARAANKGHNTVQSELRPAAAGVAIVAKLHNVTPVAKTSLGDDCDMNNPHGKIINPYPNDSKDDTCPLMVSVYPYSADNGKIATDMATRSKDDKNPTIQHNPTMIHGITSPFNNIDPVEDAVVAVIVPLLAPVESSFFDDVSCSGVFSGLDDAVSCLESVTVSVSKGRVIN
mmetsp:Transcript_5270/g.7445  ORF Transcript_5270/g.7445 Transcript_5270/m.7445 type:complete len:203 (-) Transcript_5270:517-1125(-)